MTLVSPLPGQDISIGERRSVPPSLSVRPPFPAMLPWTILVGFLISCVARIVIEIKRHLVSFNVQPMVATLILFLGQVIALSLTASHRSCNGSQTNRDRNTRVPIKRPLFSCVFIVLVAWSEGTNLRLYVERWANLVKPG